MATRTVRLDPETEKTLHEIRQATGIPISEAFKQGLRSLQQQVRHENGRTPWDVYKELDLGHGRYAVTPSTETRRGVLRAIKRKLGR